MNSSSEVGGSGRALAVSSPVIWILEMVIQIRHSGKVLRARWVSRIPVWVGGLKVGSKFVQSGSATLKLKNSP
jgi:hypothetical protein